MLHASATLMALKLPPLRKALPSVVLRYQNEAMAIGVLPTHRRTNRVMIGVLSTQCATHTLPECPGSPLPMLQVALRPHVVCPVHHLPTQTRTHTHTHAQAYTITNTIHAHP